MRGFEAQIEQVLGSRPSSRRRDGRRPPANLNVAKLDYSARPVCRVEGEQKGLKVDDAGHKLRGVVKLSSDRVAGTPSSSA
jgi:hypothetical protein